MPSLLILLAFGVALGCLLTQWQSALLSALALVVSVIYLYFKQQRTALFILLMLLHVLWGNYWLDQQLSHRLPLALDQSSAQLSLKILKHERKLYSQTIVAEVLKQHSEIVLPPLRLVQLNLYRSKQPLEVGDFLEVQVKLRSPRGFQNHLPFDYEAWLLARGIDATGYIQQVLTVQQQGTVAYRHALIAHLEQSHSPSSWPWLAGLVLGEQAAFSAQQWSLAKQTGTLHLLVVSGMHVGIVLVLLSLLWRLLGGGLLLLLGRSPLWLLRLRFVFLCFGSFAYLWLAGMGVALQRAWLMFVLVLLLQQTRLQINWLLGLAFAGYGIILINPLAWQSAGFGYSFLAVASLLCYFLGRKTGVFQALWQPQLVVSFALLPLFIYWQQPFSFVQILANLVAIPFITLLLMPLALLNLCLPSLALDTALVWLGQLFWQMLQFFSELPFLPLSYLVWPLLVLWLPILYLIRQGVGWLLAAIALVAMFGAAFWVRPDTTKVRMLDVGQGQALLFTSASKALLYDAGPSLGEKLDAGSAVILPTLNSLGIKRLDAFIVSHADDDHAGGSAVIAQTMPITELWVGENLPAISQHQSSCAYAPARWQVLSEQAYFRFLNLPSSYQGLWQGSSNNKSCVVQLVWHGLVFLLPGDIAKDKELALVNFYGKQLKADILIASHHGSKSSSSAAFLAAVQPQEVWISSGFHNRFGHPSAEVITRIEKQGIIWRNTAEVGAVTIQDAGQIITYQEIWHPPWRQQ